MQIDISGLEITKVIVHEVRKHYVMQKKEQPRFSEIESPLSEDIKLFLNEKIIETIGGFNSYEVNFVQNSGSPVPDIVRALLSRNYSDSISDPDFILLSKEIAIHLNDVQSGNNPTGLVTIVAGSIENIKTIGVLKLEREEGIRLEQVQREGKPTYDILHLRDLILTEKTKLFKIGLFFGNGLEELGYDGKVCDTQLSYTSAKGVAEFFLFSFLGCYFVGDPKIQTRDFFIFSQRYFEEIIRDPILQAQYNIHLLSYVSSESPTINATKFASSYLNIEHRKSYTDYLGEKKVSTSDIIRNTTLINKKIRRMTLEFENGIKIIGSQEDFEAGVDLEDLGDNVIKAEIVSKVRKIRT